MLAACMAGTSTVPVLAAEEPFIDGPEFVDAADTMRQKIWFMLTYNGNSDGTGNDMGELILTGKNIKVAAYTGEVPEGKKFAGWSLNNSINLYQPEEDLTLNTANGKQIQEDSYQFIFDPVFESEPTVEEVANVRFEGMGDITDTAELGAEYTLMTDFNGEVPAGKVFAGWDLDGMEYAPGATVTLLKELAEDKGISDGKHNYMFEFKARFEDVVIDKAFVQFEGVDQVAEVELGSTVEGLWIYTGEVPEGKVFAGWTLDDGKTVIDPNAAFTFDKDLGVFMEGFNGYLFDFKAAFKVAEKDVELTYIDKDTKKVVKRETITVNADDQKVDHNVIESNLPADYRIADCDEVIHGSVVAVFVEKVVKTKNVYVYYTFNGHRVDSEKLVVKKTATKVDVRDLTAPKGFVIVNTGYLRIRNNRVYVTVKPVDKKLNIEYKTASGNVIANESMTVAYSTRYIDASALKAPNGYVLVSKGRLYIGRNNTVTAIVKAIPAPVVKNISKLSFSGVRTYYNYTGRQIRPSVTIKDGRKVLTAGKDYSISYKNNIRQGRATITITGKGNYTGRKTITFRIVKF